jgi:hypothetical protein
LPQDKSKIGLTKYWEINANLDDGQSGLSNYQAFEDTIKSIKDYYDRVFGKEIMNRIPFYVDNGTADSGYTPIATPVLERIVVIKLGIRSTDDKAKIAYQFAHELTHVVFRAYFGMKKPRATADEEAICTAASLIIIKKSYPDHFERFEQCASSNLNKGYQKGVPLAKELSYDMEELRSRIESFSYSKE